MPSFYGLSAEGNARRVLWTLALVFWFVAMLSYIWGDPVRGPFAGLRHPHAANTFSFHAGMTVTYPLKRLSAGIDFSQVINMPNSPITLKVTRTWWAGWTFEVALKTATGHIEIMNKKSLIRGLPSGWDYNSDEYAIEIVDDSGQPVFQLIQDLEYDIYVNAIIKGPQGVTVMNGDNLLINYPEDKIQPYLLIAIFKYPSYMQRGKRL